MYPTYREITILHYFLVIHRTLLRSHPSNSLGTKTVHPHLSSGTKGTPEMTMTLSSFSPSINPIHRTETWVGNDCGRTFPLLHYREISVHSPLQIREVARNNRTHPGIKKENKQLYLGNNRFIKDRTIRRRKSRKQISLIQNQRKKKKTEIGQHKDSTVEEIEIHTLYTAFLFWVP